MIWGFLSRQTAGLTQALVSRQAKSGSTLAANLACKRVLAAARVLSAANSSTARDLCNTTEHPQRELSLQEVVVFFFFNIGGRKSIQVKGSGFRNKKKVQVNSVTGDGFRGQEVNSSNGQWI